MPEEPLLLQDPSEPEGRVMQAVLDRDERIREKALRIVLETLPPEGAKAEEIVRVAAVYERYLSKGEVPTAGGQ